MNPIHRLGSLVARVPAPLRATALYMLAMVWGRAMAMITVPLLARTLPPGDLGRLDLLSSFAEIGGMLAGAGLVDALYRFGGNDAAGRRAAGQVMGLALGVAGVVGGAIAIFSSSIAAAMPLPTAPSEVLLLGTAAALEPVIGVPLAWLRMNGRAALFTVVAVARVTIQLGLVIALVANGSGIWGVVLAGWAAATLTALVGTGLQARDTGLRLVPAETARVLAYGLPLIGSAMAAFVLGTADRWLLAGVVPAAALGFYALATKAAMILSMLMQPFEMWWYPRRIALLKAPDGREQSARALGAGMAWLITGSAITAAAGPMLIHIAAAPAYAPAAVYVPWLVLCIALSSVCSMANVGCYVGRTGALPMALNSAAAVVALGFYLLLIPRFGVAGAIAATVIAQAARLVMFAAVSQRIVRLPWPVGRIVLATVPAIAAAAAPQWLPLWPGTLLGGALAVVTAGGVVALGLVAIPDRFRPARFRRAPALPALGTV